MGKETGEVHMAQFIRPDALILVWAFQRCKGKSNVRLNKRSLSKKAMSLSLAL